VRNDPPPFDPHPSVLVATVTPSSSRERLMFPIAVKQVEAVKISPEQRGVERGQSTGAEELDAAYSGQSKVMVAGIGDGASVDNIVGAEVETETMGLIDGVSVVGLLEGRVGYQDENTVGSILGCEHIIGGHESVLRSLTLTFFEVERKQSILQLSEKESEAKETKDGGNRTGPESFVQLEKA
jgi:hypothetical protein